jgi:rod shape-determining protein MreC
LQRLRSLEVENVHLRDLLGAAVSLQPATRLAEILHMGRDPFTHKVVVNLGARQNIVAGQAVVDAKGIIGQVTRVYPFSSEVTLITDKGLSIPVQVERSGLRAIVFGQGQGNLIDLPYLPPNVDVREGDMLVTSGIDGVYPPGLAVARVTMIDRDPDSPFAHIVCTPIAGIENHKQVLLLSLPAVDTSHASHAATPAGTNAGAPPPKSADVAR